jgi:hypothetical protein
MMNVTLCRASKKVQFPASLAYSLALSGTVRELRDHALALSVPSASVNGICHNVE